MDKRRVRLGDVIDDYCPRCRLIMNHGVVGMIGDEVKKVRCNTCMSEHQFRHGRLPAGRRSETKKLFDEVLRGIAGPGAGPDDAGAAAGDVAGDAAGDAAPAPARPAHAHRRLYSIHRALKKKDTGRDPKKS
jgi:hypothetical protein